MKKKMFRIIVALTALSFSAAYVQAQDNDPPTRAARLAYIQGGVSFRPAGADEWLDPGLNRPLTIGDQLWSDRAGRVEIQLDGSNVRMGPETSAGILDLNDQNTQLQLSSGTLIVHVRDLDDNESYEIDTPTVAFSILRPGTYRLSVDPNGQSTTVSVRNGQGEAAGTNGVGYTIRAGEEETFSGDGDQLQADNYSIGPQDEFDNWCQERDYRFDHAQSARYVSPDVVGYEELDNQGDWDDTPEYGHVWFPSGVEVGWAPYHFGHWAYIAPWGYTWVDDRPWGFAPFHYGRWVFWRHRWGWVPVAPRLPRVEYVRPVYAPALVAWVGGTAGAAVAWFPLAPREVYVPSYPVSRRYLNVVNVSNTRVNTTIINNVYNTTIINNTTVNNITYANRHVPGAVVATSSQNFMNARAVRPDHGKFDPRSFENAPVQARAPAIVPTRNAVFGGREVANIRPPQAVQTRVTNARLPPPAAPPSIDQRLQALRDSNGRRPLPPPAASAPPQARPEAVRVLPPVRTLLSARDQAQAPRPVSPSVAPPAPSGRAPTHANQLPVQPRPSPAAADSVLERQQTQERIQLQSRQDAERQKVEHQQALEDKRITDQQAANQRRQQLEQQRANQLQQQQQQQQQQQLAQQRAQQEDQRRAQLEQQRNAQLQQQQAQQAQQQRAQLEQQRNAQLQQQQQQQAAQQRAQQEEQRRTQIEQERAAQLQQQQQAQRAQLEQQRAAQLQQQQQQQQQRQMEERQRQIELQHQQQTEQLAQQHAQQQREMQERQEAAQRAQQVQQQQQQQRKVNPPPNQRQQ